MLGIYIDMCLTFAAVIWLTANAIRLALYEDQRSNWKALIFPPLCLATGTIWSYLYLQVNIHTHFHAVDYRISLLLELAFEILTSAIIPLALYVLVRRLTSLKQAT